MFLLKCEEQQSSIAQKNRLHQTFGNKWKTLVGWINSLLTLVSSWQLLTEINIVSVLSAVSTLLQKDIQYYHLRTKSRAHQSRAFKKSPSLDRKSESQVLYRQHFIHRASESRMSICAKTSHSVQVNSAGGCAKCLCLYEIKSPASVNSKKCKYRHSHLISFQRNLV